MDFIDVTIRESVYLKHGMNEQKALIYLDKYKELMPFEEVKYLELCFLDNHQKGTLLYDPDFIRAAYEKVKGRYGLTAVLHPGLVDLERWDPEVIRCFSSIRFMINGKMDEHCEAVIDYIHALGVAVSINVIYISRKDRDFVLDCLRVARRHNVEVFTFADSCGSCMPEEVTKQLGFVKDYDPAFKRNFHFHNHFNLALTNALACSDLVDLMDASVHGYGKGGGNLNLEQVLFSGRVRSGRLVPAEAVVRYAELLKFLVGDIFEEDWRQALEEYKNLLIGYYNLNLKDVDELEEQSGGDAICFCACAAEKGIRK